MAKTKTSKKHANSFDPNKVRGGVRRGVKTYSHEPSSTLRNRAKVKKALLECVAENDWNAFKEILLNHIEAINKADALKKSSLSERTLYHALSPKGNPSLKTVSKIIEAFGLAS